MNSLLTGIQKTLAPRKFAHAEAPGRDSAQVLTKLGRVKHETKGTDGHQELDSITPPDRFLP